LTGRKIVPKSRLVLSKLLILKKIAVHLIRNEKFSAKAGGGTRLRQGYAVAGEGRGTMDNGQGTMDKVQWTRYNLQSTIYKVQSTMYLPPLLRSFGETGKAY